MAVAGVALAALAAGGASCAAESSVAATPCAAVPALAAPATASSDLPAERVRRRIYLLRHGEAAYYDAAGKPVPDPDAAGLTARGLRQAQLAGEWLCAAGAGKVDLMISSPLPRAQQTARELLQAMGLAIELQTWPELREVPAAAQESPEATRARIVPALSRLFDQRDWDTAIVIAHSHVNLVLLSEVLTGESRLLDRLEFGNGCLNVLDLGPGPRDWIVRAVNLCPDAAIYGTRRSSRDRLRQPPLK